MRKLAELRVLLRYAQKMCWSFSVNSDSPDRELAGEITKLLVQEGVGYSMPLATGSPDEIRTDLEENLLNCDGLLLIYGATTAS